MTNREEIERLLNQTGRTLEGLPEFYPEEQAIKVFKETVKHGGLWENKLLHQSDVIELLVGALRDALDKPMQKPLTLEELKEAEIVWVEIDDESETILALNDGISDKCVYFIMGHGRHTHSYIEQYGKYWRAWASRPTDEEREAAAWEN